MAGAVVLFGVRGRGGAGQGWASAAAHAHLNVKIFAGLPGLTTGYGGTHQAIEDTGLARLIPDLVVIDPAMRPK